jgi:hypothetical protein
MATAHARRPKPDPDGPIGSVLQEHPEALRQQVADTLAGMLEGKREPGGLRLAAAAWIVTARSE